MKLYEYRCPKCQKSFEEVVKDDKEIVECPDCKIPAEQVKLAFPKHARHQSWRVT